MSRKYVVVERNKIVDLEINVRDLIEQGYQPIGGMAIGQFTKWVEGLEGNEPTIGSYYTQAMYKPPTQEGE